MVVIDSPFVEILPLKSLLIFSAISVISIIAGLTIINLKNNDNSSQEDESHNKSSHHFYSEVLANYFLNISGFFSLATVGIFSSAILYCLENGFLDLIAYFIKTVVIFIYVIGYTGLVWHLLVSRIKWRSDLTDFESLHRSYLEIGNP